MIEATAPGKVILFGEHAVVYGRPAIAAPVNQLRARAVIEQTGGPDVVLIAPDLNLSSVLSLAAVDDPLAAAVRIVSDNTRPGTLEGLTITVTSQIPIAGGLGSGAAIAVAIIRALLVFLGLSDKIDNAQISDWAYQVERLHHGTPSGIDNTVIAYEQAVYFVRREPNNQIVPFRVGRPLRLLIADTGIRSATKDVVGDVRRQWLANPEQFEPIFDACGRIAEAGYQSIIAGDLTEVGRLMSKNHEWLKRMTVSSAELDRLVAAAVGAGALGAKLSGAGRGGNMIALVESHNESVVRDNLLAAGAVTVLASDVG